MDNIIIKKIWEDEGLIELRITAISEYVTAYQDCYIDVEKLSDISTEICSYSYNYNENCKVQFGEESEEYTPSFSMTILKADMNGRVKIEVNIYVDDSENNHMCCYYIKSELGCLQRFGEELKKLASVSIDDSIQLNN